jgi:DNA-binding MarR family transcriptional regulator
MYMHQSEATHCACMALRKASRVLTAIYDEHLSRHGVTITQFSLLRNIRRRQTVTLSELAEAMVMDRTTLYRTIQPLEKAGLVVIADAEKGNIRLASLTKSGQAKLAAAEPDWKKSEAEINRRLGADTLSSLHSISYEIIELAKV